MFVTRDVFRDDSDEVIRCLEGESGLQACYTCTFGAGEDVRLWGLRFLEIGMVGGMKSTLLLRRVFVEGLFEAWWIEG